MSRQLTEAEKSAVMSQADADFAADGCGWGPPHGGWALRVRIAEALAPPRVYVIQRPSGAAFGFGRPALARAIDACRVSFPVVVR